MLKFKLKLVIFILFFFLLLFSSISLVNHYNLRTFAWDLGINNNAIFDYAHLRWNDCMLLTPQFTNILADHFTIYPILISPFYYITGSYTMLIFQILSILFGAYGIFLLFNLKYPKNSWIPLISVIHFLSIFGIYSALSFDYHDNVVAAMFVPWLFYSFEIKNYKMIILFSILMCIGKENMALWLIFIMIGIALSYPGFDKRRNYAFLISFLSLLYFFVIVKFIIPELGNNDQTYLHFKYKALGENSLKVLETFFSKPGYIFKLFFETHHVIPEAFGAKPELHFMVLLSGGIFIFLRPKFLIMLIPIYGQKLFNDDFTKWGINDHYSIEFVPILCIAAFSYLVQLKKHQLTTGIAVTLLTIVATMVTIGKRNSNWYHGERLQFYSPNHYYSDFNTKAIYEGMKLIPDSASVSASSFLVSHLAFRQYIYQFPDGTESDYIVLQKNEHPYPLSREDLELKVYELSKSHITIFSKSEFYIFKKNPTL